MSLSDLLFFFLLLLNLPFLVSAAAHIPPSSSVDYPPSSLVSAKKTVITEDAFTWQGRTYPAHTFTADDTPDSATVPASSPLAHHGLPTSTIVRLVTLPPTAAASVPVTFVTSYVQAEESLPVTAGADLYYTRPAASPLAASPKYSSQKYTSPGYPTQYMQPSATSLASTDPYAVLPEDNVHSSLGNDTAGGNTVADPYASPTKSIGASSPKSTYNGEAYGSGSSTASADFGSPTSGSLYDQESLTCTFDSANKVTIQGVVGQWGGTYLKHTLSACSHRINNYKDHFAKLANATQTIDFHVGDVEINQSCIEKAIRVAGGTLGPQGCRWAHVDPKTTTQTSHTADDPATYARPHVSVNWWQGMRDNNDHYGWGFWELYNITGWRTPNYATHDWPTLSGADIARNLYTRLAKCDQSILMNYEYWRQAYDTANHPVVFFGLDIDGHFDCFTDAIRQSGGPNPYEYGIAHQAHDARWQAWHKGLAPFKFVDQLPKHDQFSGWPNLTLPAGGFGSEGEVCFPVQGGKADCRSS